MVNPNPDSVKNVTVVFDLPNEYEYRFTMYPNPDTLIEYPLICEWYLPPL